MTVHEMELKMPAAEFQQWIEYSRVEPFNVAEVQMAGLMSMASSYMGASNPPKEFMISHASEVKEEEGPLKGSALEDYLKGII